MTTHHARHPPYFLRRFVAPFLRRGAPPANAMALTGSSVFAWSRQSPEFWLDYLGIVVIAHPRSLPRPGGAIYFYPATPQTTRPGGMRSTVRLAGTICGADMAGYAIYATLPDVNLSAWWLLLLAVIVAGLAIQPIACGGYFLLLRFSHPTRRQWAKPLRRGSAWSLARCDVSPRPLKAGATAKPEGAGTTPPIALLDASTKSKVIAGS
jgi:hypothetical protein